MNRNGRFRAILVGAIAVGATVVAAAPAARSSGSPAPKVPSLDWVECSGGLTCASATVPLDYDQPRGATIEVGLIRMAATDPAHKIGTLFVGAIGSSSGFELIRDFGGILFDPSLRARFDVVGFDRRGVQRTMPVRCFDTTAEMEGFYGAKEQYPVGRDERAELAAQSRSFAAGCEERSGDLLAHASSADVARDLDLLRQAVGDDKLNYFGPSHSAYVGLIYANLFPNNVRSLILDSPQYAPSFPDGPPITAPLSRTNADLGAEVSLREFFAQCARAGVAACPFAAGGDLRSKYDRLMMRLHEHPLGAELGFTNFGEDELAALASGLMFAAEGYALLAEDLQYLFETSVVGNSARATALRLRAMTEDYANYNDAFNAIFCADMQTPRTVGQIEAAARLRDRVSPHFGHWYAYYTSLCADYPGPAEDRYTGPWGTRTSAPALVIGSTYDPITYLPGVRATTRLIPGSRLLTLHAWGHTSLAVSECANAAIADYVVHGTLPAVGTVCESDTVPFG